MRKKNCLQDPHLTGMLGIRPREVLPQMSRLAGLTNSRTRCNFSRDRTKGQPTGWRPSERRKRITTVDGERDACERTMRSWRGTGWILRRCIDGPRLRFMGTRSIENVGFISIANFHINGIRRRTRGTTNIFLQTGFGYASRESKDDEVLPGGFTVFKRVDLKDPGVTGADQIEILTRLFQR